MPLDQPLGSLSADEQEQLCADRNGYEADAEAEHPGLVSATECLASAISATLLGEPANDDQARELCQAEYDTCESIGYPITVDCPEYDADCTATIADLEACINDSWPTYANAVAGYPACQELTLAVLATLTPVTPPSSCFELNQLCP